jgi:hypothetical protein
MTEAESLVLWAVCLNATARCALIGVRVWGTSGPSVDGGSHSLNRHARTAGKVLRRLQEKGLVRQDVNLNWHLTLKANAVLIADIQKHGKRGRP